MKKVEDQQQGVRTTGRIKKPKAVFDPSDNYLPKANRPAAATVHAAQDASLRRLSSTSSDGNTLSKEICMVCGKRESKRTSFAYKNRLISCSECQSKIHKQCLKADVEDFEKLRQNYKCDKCNPCNICHKVDNSGNNVSVCSKCTKVYHNNCLDKKVEKPGQQQSRDWKCSKCASQPELSNDGNMPVKKIHEIIGSQMQPVPVVTNSVSPKSIKSTSERHSTETTDNEKLPSKNEKPAKNFEKLNNLEKVTAASNLKRPHSNESEENDDILSEENEKRSKVVESPSDKVGSICTESVSSRAPSRSLENAQNTPNDLVLDDIPDVKNWSVDQVFNYFQKRFPLEAHVFKDHEIDGRSLLLIKRSDVVKKMPLKLGPSLRIYSLILQIQTQLNDPTLGWNCSL